VGEEAQERQPVIESPPDHLDGPESQRIVPEIVTRAGGHWLVDNTSCTFSQCHKGTLIDSLPSSLAANMPMSVVSEEIRRSPALVERLIDLTAREGAAAGQAAASFPRCPDS
jgi:hypothetical protein